MRKLIFVSVTLLLATACIGLVQFTAVNMEAYNQTQDKIALLKDKNIELNVNILRTNLRLNQNYDPLLLLQQDIETIERNLLQAEISEEFTRHLRLLLQISQQKFDYLEQFKTDYAVLKNAESSLPTLADELSDNPKLPAQLRSSINAFAKHILHYRLLENSTLEQELQSEIEYLKAQKASLPSSIQESYNLLIIHAQNLMSKHKALLTLFEDLYSSQIFYEIERLQQIFEFHYHKKIYQGRILNYLLIALIVALLSVLFVIARRMIRTQYSLTRSNQKLNRAFRELTETQEELERSNYLLSRQNENTVASMKYGKRIQQIHLPSTKELARIFPNHFIYYNPKDLVSGDFYWFHERDNKIFFAVADATGHGVPGAMLSIMGIRLLDGIVGQQKVSDPGKILTHLDKQMNTALKQRDTNNKDGMDIAIVVIDKDTQNIQFSGAKNDLFYINKLQHQRIRGNRFSIGGVYDKTKQFDTITISLPQDTPSMIYLYSDGFQDQFGGKYNRKYGARQFRNFLQFIHQYPIIQQDDLIRQELAKWKGIGTQTDDILVFGCQLLPKQTSNL